MNNWKLRALVNDDDTMDLYEANGHLGLFYTSDVSVAFVPFGDKFAAPLRTSASDDFGPVSNQVPGICNGTFTHTGSGSATVSATTLTGEGSSATFTYTFLADGTLSTIVAASGGSGYKVGDKLRITTSASHGSQVIEFRLVDGSNATLLYATMSHDRTAPSFPFAVHKFRINNSSARPVAVLDYRSSQVFPRPQDKLLDKYPDAAAAYGLRLLRSAYLGPAIRVRRESTGNPEKDIYFDGQGNLDTATLLAFAGSQTVTVDTWYDQSGRGNDASQGGTSNQPTIVDAGTLVTVNDKPALEFDGSDDKFDIGSSDLYGQDRLDAYMHYQTEDTTYLMFSQSTSGGNHSLAIAANNTSTALSSNYGAADVQMYINGVKAPHVSGTTTRGDLYDDFVVNGASHSNGAVVVHEDALTTTWTDFKISSINNFWFNGKLTEMVIYNTDQSANRENIEKDMALHSGAYQVEDAPLLDAYGGAHAAYSLRKLNSDYTGAAIRLRRTSDSEEQDIGFDADGNLDITACEAFFTGSNLTVKTWYDQSGNGNDMTQSTAAAQPLLYNIDGLLKIDGRPGLRFIAGDAFDFDKTGLDRGNLSSFAVLKFTNLTGTQRVIQLSTGTSERWYGPVLSSSQFVYAHGDGNIGSNAADLLNNLHTVIAGATQGDVEAFLNGTSIGTKALTTGALAGTSKIGGTGVDYFNGYIQEVVVYSSDQSERREGIERNISNHYDL